MKSSRITVSAAAALATALVCVPAAADDSPLVNLVLGADVQIGRGAPRLAPSTVTVPVAKRAYPAGDYDLGLRAIKIADIVHTVDPEQYCAELYGQVTVSRGGKSMKYFEVSESNPVEVCEPNRPINEGSQVGTLQVPNANTTSRAAFTGVQSADEPYVFTVDLWDEDTGADDHLVDNKTVKVWPRPTDTMPAPVDFQERGFHIYLDYSLESLDKRKSHARQELSLALKGKQSAMANCMKYNHDMAYCTKHVGTFNMEEEVTKKLGPFVRLG